MTHTGHPLECRGECSWIFSDLDEKGLKELRAMARPVSYDKGELIFQEGEPAFGFYVICTGKVKLAKHSPTGKKQILKLLGPGEILGEKTMFDREVYTAYAQTLEPTRMNFYQREPFIAFLGEVSQSRAQDHREAVAGDQGLPRSSHRDELRRQ
jgi:CRP-like cAMP-binding protein